jgi:hypothetical protein
MLCKHRHADTFPSPAHFQRNMASLPSHGIAYSNPTTNFIEDGETGI